MERSEGTEKFVAEIMEKDKKEVDGEEKSSGGEVTYSDRRDGLFEKAHKFGVLFDAKVSIIMISSSEEIHEYNSPNTTVKEMIDLYQKAMEVDLWNPHYERMQEILKNLNEENSNIRKQIRLRHGENLDELDIAELRLLEQEMEKAANFVRQRKNRVLGNIIDTMRKKTRNARDIHDHLVRDLEERIWKHSQNGIVDNGGGDYEPRLKRNADGFVVLGLSNNNEEDDPTGSIITSLDECV